MRGVMPVGGGSNWGSWLIGIWLIVENYNRAIWYLVDC